MIHLRATAALLTLLAVGAATPAHMAVHEEGVLHLKQREIAPGGTLGITGEKFAREATLRLLLVSLSGRREVARVRTDTTGAFTLELSIPRHMDQGDARLVAIAADGDEVASADLTIAAAAEELARLEEATHDEPSAVALDLDRARTPLSIGAALGGIIFALAAASVLLRRSRRD